MKHVGLHKTRAWLCIVETYHLVIKMYSVRFEKTEYTILENTIYNIRKLLLISDPRIKGVFLNQVNLLAEASVVVKK